MENSTLSTGDGLTVADMIAPDIALQQHVTVQLKGFAALRSRIDGVADNAAPATRGRQVTIAVVELQDWSGGGFSGREIQLAMTVQDDDRNDRKLGEALAVIDVAMASLEPEFQGWCIVNMRPLTRRILRGSDARWRALGRYRFRVIQQEN